MSIKLYNSLTNQKEDLVPADGKTIRMYSCGVTVYDRCHVGHGRSLYIFDVIRAYLEQYSGYKVHFVRNITDVDDKIINKSKELKQTFEQVVADNIAAYEQDLVQLGVRSADQEPRATQYIDNMIAFIEQLIEKGYAYQVGGSVYYSVRKFTEYGKLSNQSIDQMLEATRIDADEQKKDPLDFALWKEAKEGEKAWPSPWGEGRPGWHIECSCMSMKELGAETIDIHAGGRDLIFPHHENEIAQSEALTGKTFARYWIHHGLLTINGQKMAKSLGNFITLEDILQRFPNDILKLFFLQSHYASPIDFSYEKMEEVKKAYDRFHILLEKLERRLGAFKEDDSADLTEGMAKHFAAFREAMDDDFNTPKALAGLFDLVSETNPLLEKDGPEVDADLRSARSILYKAFSVFGLTFQQDTVSEEILALLEERKAARAQKDFKRSDDIRDLLRTKGIIVEDGKDGQTWRKA